MGRFYSKGESLRADLICAEGLPLSFVDLACREQATVKQLPAPGRRDRRSHLGRFYSKGRAYARSDLRGGLPFELFSAVPGSWEGAGNCLTGLPAPGRRDRRERSIWGGSILRESLRADLICAEGLPLSRSTPAGSRQLLNSCLPPAGEIDGSHLGRFALGRAYRGSDLRGGLPFELLDPGWEQATV